MLIQAAYSPSGNYHLVYVCGACNEVTVAMSLHTEAKSNTIHKEPRRSDHTAVLSRLMFSSKQIGSIVLSCVCIISSDVVCTHTHINNTVCPSLGLRPKPTPAQISSNIMHREAIRTGVGLGLGPRLCLSM